MRPRNEEMKLQIYEFIKNAISTNGTSPTMDEVAAHFNCSKPVVFKYVDRLLEEGYLQKNGRYQLTIAAINSSMNDAPLFGGIPCGEPRDMNPEVEEVVRLPVAIFGTGEFYLLRASGHSMINAGIDDGDLVVIRVQPEANDGDIAVVLTNETENTLKRVYFEQGKKRLRLHPENDDMEDFYVRDFKIQGVAVHVIKKLR